MKTTRALMPRARQDELVVEELQDETLVYPEASQGALPKPHVCACQYAAKPANAVRTRARITALSGIVSESAAVK